MSTTTPANPHGSPADQPKLMDPSSNDPPTQNANQNNPNPYLRRYGSHVKSHFSQSRCEFFESSEEDNKIPQENKNNVNSLDHIKDIKTDGQINHSSNYVGPAQGKNIDQVKEEFFTNNGKMGKSPSIDSQNETMEDSVPLPEMHIPNLNINGEGVGSKELQRKDSLEMELDDMDDEDDRKSALIIKSRRGSVSEDSFDEGGDNIKPDVLFVNKHFKNGEVVENKKNEQENSKN